MLKKYNIIKLGFYRVKQKAGTHTELMNHNGLYRKLKDIQFEFGVVTQSPVVNVEGQGGRMMKQTALR